MCYPRRLLSGSRGSEWFGSFAAVVIGYIAAKHGQHGAGDQSPVSTQVVQQAHLQHWFSVQTADATNTYLVFLVTRLGKCDVQRSEEDRCVHYFKANRRLTQHMVHKVTVKNVHPGLHLLDEPDFVKLDELGHHSLCSDEPKLCNVADKDSDLAVHCHYQVPANVDEVTTMKPDTSQNPHLTCSLVHNLKEDHVGKLHLHHVSLVQHHQGVNHLEQPQSRQQTKRPQDHHGHFQHLGLGRYHHRCHAHHSVLCSQQDQGLEEALTVTVVAGGMAEIINQFCMGGIKHKTAKGHENPELLQAASHVDTMKNVTNPHHNIYRDPPHAMQAATVYKHAQVYPGKQLGCLQADEDDKLMDSQQHHRTLADGSTYDHQL